MGLAPLALAGVAALGAGALLGVGVLAGSLGGSMTLPGAAQLPLPPQACTPAGRLLPSLSAEQSGGAEVIVVTATANGAEPDQVARTALIAAYAGPRPMDQGHEPGHDESPGIFRPRATPTWEASAEDDTSGATATFTAWVGSDVYRMSRDIRPEDVAGVPEDLMPRQMQWGIEAICTRFGVPSFHAWRDAMTSYRLGDLIGAITCPVLALVGEREGDEPRAQFEAFMNGVAGTVTSRVFRPADGASAHCQSDNLRLSAQVTYDWLDSELT